MSETVYKIARATEWEAAEEAGVFLGSPDDRRDGYIHLSSLAQLRQTYQKHFDGERDLLLVAIDATRLRHRLRWETSRSGEQFPHLYGPLDLPDIESVAAIAFDRDGQMILPEETGMQKITPFLWFDTQAEEAANFYVSIFKNSKIKSIDRYGEAGARAARREKGSVMTVAFELDGQEFVAINGGPQFRFNEAVSFVVNCSSQDEIDYYWDKLSAGGDEKAQQCGWLKDKYGVSWQVVPTIIRKLLQDPGKSEKLMAAVLRMKKIDLGQLKRATA
jgi:predicted 3-demethylubiquinone-9 3-methyltransferase (glyoxalase superfamily)/uncharacterized protein (DUF952 family)